MEGLHIAVIGLLGTLGGAVITLWAKRWQLTMEREEHDEDQVIEFYKGALARAEAREQSARAECRRWQDLALRNLGTIEETSENLKQLNTSTGGTP